MKKQLCPQELARRIELNFTRLSEGDYYQIENVFAPAEYDWPGDKEGRALLAFVSLYKATGKRSPAWKRCLPSCP